VTTSLPSASTKPEEGETGILFAGMAHQVDKYLPKDIHISYLIFRLPFSKLRPAGNL